MSPAEDGWDDPDDSATEARAQAAIDGWDVPVPIGREIELPPFPVDALPPWLGGFVSALSVATQTPTDLAGALALAVLATAAGGRAVVEVRPGWREPVNLFVAVAMAPGSRKSAVFARVVEPLNVAEREAIERAKPLVVEAATRRAAQDGAAAAALLLAGKAPEPERAEAIADAVAAAEMAGAIAVPALPRLLVDDCTPEALGSLLVEQGGRVALLSPEGDVFDQMAGRYSAGPNFGVYLKGHAGDALRVDRKGRPPEYVAAPALTVGLAVQPQVLADLADKPGFRGRGLLARFLYSLPVNNVGTRRPGAPPVPSAIADRYDSELATLARSLADWIDPAVIPFSAEADGTLLAFEERIEPVLGPGGSMGHIADWGAKLAGAAARIAGLLHLGADVRTGWGSPVQAPTVEAAIRLADYFAAHAVAVFDLMSADPLIADARAVAEWLVDREEFTRRDAHQALRGRFVKVADIDPALGLLEDHGWVRRLPPPEPTPSGGRPPSPAYRVNPHAHNTHNTHNLRPGSRLRGSESCESSERTSAREERGR